MRVSTVSVVTVVCLLGLILGIQANYGSYGYMPMGYGGGYGGGGGGGWGNGAFLALIGLLFLMTLLFGGIYNSSRGSNIQIIQGNTED